MPCAEAGIRQTSRAAPPAALRAVVGADGEQARQLARRAGVRLQRAGVVAGHRAQPALQVADQLGVAGRVGRGRERVQPGELRPGDRLHLGGRVQLHRAGAERDHRPVEGHVEVGQAAQVAQHPGLAAVRAEHRVGEELGGPGQRRGHGVLVRRPTAARSAGSSPVPAMDAPASAATTSRRCSGRGRLVAGDLDDAVARVVQVVPGLPGAGHARPAPRPARAAGRRPCRRATPPAPSSARSRAAWRRGSARAGAPAGRWRSARPGRGSTRTSRRPRPAAPGRCRCCSSPSPGGCAARAPAAPAGRRGGRRRRPTPRPGGRAAACAGRRGPPGRRRAGRRRTSARRTAGWSRARCRRRTRPAA